MKQSTFDQGLFYWYKSGKLGGIMVCFVDDQLWGGSMEFEIEVIQKLRETFNVNYEHSKAFKYVGIDLKQTQDGSITLNQEPYIKTITPINLEKERCNQKEELATEGEKELRGITGRLNWASGISRPDIGYNVSEMSSVIKNARVKDLLKANKTLKYLNNTHTNIKFPKMSSLKDLKIVMYSDASFMNLSDGGSQGGFVVFLSDNKDTCCPLSWKSTKIKRIVRSTLAAETLAFTEGADTAYLMSKIVGEIITGKESMIPIHCMTDNKSLFDASQTTNLISDKRLQVEIASIRQMIERNEIQIKLLTFLITKIIKKKIIHI